MSKTLGFILLVLAVDAVLGIWVNTPCGNCQFSFFIRFADMQAGNGAWAQCMAWAESFYGPRTSFMAQVNDVHPPYDCSADVCLSFKTNNLEKDPSEAQDLNEFCKISGATVSAFRCESAVAEPVYEEQLTALAEAVLEDLPTESAQPYTAIFVDDEVSGKNLTIQVLTDTGRNLYMFLQSILTLFSFQWIDYPELGHFLNCIGSVCSDTDQHLSWMIYVNGKLSPVGADQIVMNQSLHVSIKYEKYQISEEL